MKTPEQRIEMLENDLKRLQIILHTIINDMQALSFQDGSRTGFSEELQGQIESWKEEMDIV